jgi:predicted HicB family RNase H-like nuclease
VKSSITIRIDSDLLRKVELIATQEGISVNGLIEP